MQLKLQLRVINSAEGIIIVTGQLMCIDVHVTITPNEAHRFDPIAGPEKSNHTHRLSRGVRASRDFNFNLTLL